VERYIAGRYIPSFEKLSVLDKERYWRILEELIKAHPKGLTARDIEESTKISTAHENLKELKRENYIKELPTKRKGTGVKRSSEYIIEESSGIVNSIFGFELSPGNVEFSNDFKNAWEVLVPKEDEIKLLHKLMHFIQEIVQLTKQSNRQEVKNIAPKFNKENNRCKNCGVNHEARDFIRAVLIYLLDRLEVQREFVEFQKNEQLLTETAFKKIIELSAHLEQQDKRRVVAKTVTKPDTPKKEEELTKEPESTKITLRILSIQKDS
jgi:hypothetical protein